MHIRIENKQHQEAAAQLGLKHSAYTRHDADQNEIAVADTTVCEKLATYGAEDGEGGGRQSVLGGGGGVGVACVRSTRSSAPTMPGGR